MSKLNLEKGLFWTNVIIEIVLMSKLAKFLVQ